MDRIYDLFLALGIHSTYRGSMYLHYAVSLCLYDEGYLLCICYLYDTVAAAFGVKGHNVERFIRPVAAPCHEHRNRGLPEKIARRPLDAKPTNGELIDILCHYLRSTQG